MKMRKLERFLAVLLILSTLTAAAYPAFAEAGGTNPYRIALTVQGGWSGSNGATVKVSITDRESIGWQKIEYRMNDGNWIDCEYLFDRNKAEIMVHKNGTFTLRMTDPRGNTYEEHAEINCIDLSAPNVTASIDGTKLVIKAVDDLSGIAGIQVNSMLFTTMTAEGLRVELDENMNRFEKLVIRAFDFAGNFSEPVSLDNPHYIKQPDSTPEATATARPTKRPNQDSNKGGSNIAAPTGTPAGTMWLPDQPTATTAPRGLGSSLIYVQDHYVTEAPTAVPTAAPTPEPIIQTEYITIGPGMPFQADGNSHTLDVLYSAATNKQFITLQTKSGNTFYLVIDYDKPIDEEAELYETYFLNLVDERDLLALMSDEEKEEVPTPTPEIIYVTPVPTAVPIPTEAPVEHDDKKPDQMTGIIALIAIVALVGFGAFVLLKKKEKGTKPAADTDFYMDDDDEETDENDKP